MTLQELALKLGKSENTLKTQFIRTQETLKKKGIIITKIGTGKKADYFLFYKGDTHMDNLQKLNLVLTICNTISVAETKEDLKNAAMLVDYLFDEIDMDEDVIYDGTMIMLDKKSDKILTKKEKDGIEYLAETLDIPYTTVLRMNDEDYQNEYKKLMEC